MSSTQLADRSASAADDRPTASPGSPALAFEILNLRKEFQVGGETVVALDGVSLEVQSGDYVAIMGPSGSGKSTLLNLLGCLDSPSSGDYLIGGINTSTMNDDELASIRAQHIGFVFQAYNLIPQLSVIENVQSPLAYGPQMTAADDQRCRELIETVGLGDRTDHRPNELSGGQQQRAAIARSLANRPRFILADEPTGNLDSATTDDVLALFEELNDSGTTIVLVTHEDEVASRARRNIRLRDGAVESDIRLRPPAAQATQPAEETDEHPTRTASRLRYRWRDIRVGAKSLLMHPMRSLLTVLGIFIGVASVIWLLAIGEGISAKAQEQIEELGANTLILTTSRPPSTQTPERTMYFYGLTEEDVLRLKSIPTVEAVIPFARRAGLQSRYLDRHARTEINACTPAYLELFHLHVKRGRFLSDEDSESQSKVCVLAEELAEELFLFEDPIGRSVKIGPDYFRVVGIASTRSKQETIKGTVRGQDFSDNAYIPLGTFFTHFGDIYSVGNNGGRGVTQITLKLHDQDTAIASGIAVTEALKQTHQYDDYTVGVPMELLEQARNTRLMFMAMMGLIAAISLVVGGIGIMNIMLATVTERTREIGIRRALGAKHKDINRQFLIETVLLSIAGGFTGVLGGLTCGYLVQGIRWSMNSLFRK